MKKTLGERLRAARTSKGLSQGELAVQVGVSRTAIGQWEVNGVQPSIERLELAAKILEVRPEWLAFEVSNPSSDFEPDRVELDEIEFGPELSEASSTSTWQLPAKFVDNELMITGPTPILFRVSNNAMSPELKSGDRVIVDRGQTAIDGGIFLIWNHKAASVARLLLVRSDKETLMRIVLGDQGVDVRADSIQVLGKVVGLIRPAES